MRLPLLKLTNNWSRARAVGMAGLLIGSLCPAVGDAQPSAQVEVEVAGTTDSATAADAATTSPVAGETASGQPEEAAGAVGSEGPVDAVAIQEADRLVAPPTAVLTPAPETTGPQEVGPEVPIVQGMKVMIRDADSTEARAVASGAEILRMFGFQRPKRKPEGREVDTTGSLNLFKNEEEVKRLLGENPTVVYRVVVSGTPLPDPMVIPWLRNAQIVQELLDDAVGMLADGRVTEATEQLRAIVADYSDTEQAAKAQEILDRIIITAEETPSARQTPRGTPTPTPTPTPPPIEINPNVRVSTVLIEPNNPADNRVMIQGRGYAVGEKIRNYPDHKVISISDDTVIIEVEKEGRTKQFPLPVRSTGSNP